MNNGTTQDQQITDYLNGLYALLADSDHELADEMLGMIAEIKAGWEGDLGSFSQWTPINSLMLQSNILM